MANSTSGPLLVLDTTGTIFAATRQITIKSWRWLGATTAGHQLVVKDGQGRVRIKSVANGNNFTDADAPNLVLNGLELATMGSGELIIEAA